MFLLQNSSMMCSAVQFQPLEKFRFPNLYLVTDLPLVVLYAKQFHYESKSLIKKKPSPQEAEADFHVAPSCMRACSCNRQLIHINNLAHTPKSGSVS